MRLCPLEKIILDEWHSNPFLLLQAIWGGLVLEESGGGADVLGGAETQDGTSTSDEPPRDASAPSTGEHWNSIFLVHLLPGKTTTTRKTRSDSTSSSRLASVLCASSWLARRPPHHGQALHYLPSGRGAAGCSEDRLPLGESPETGVRLSAGEGSTDWWWCCWRRRWKRVKTWQIIPIYPACDFYLFILRAARF